MLHTLTSPLYFWGQFSNTFSKFPTRNGNNRPELKTPSREKTCPSTPQVLNFERYIAKPFWIIMDVCVWTLKGQTNKAKCVWKSCECKQVLQLKCNLPQFLKCTASNKNILFITQTWGWIYFLSPTNIHKHNLPQLLQPWRTLQHRRRPPGEAIFYVWDFGWVERMVFTQI